MRRPRPQRLNDFLTCSTLLFLIWPPLAVLANIMPLTGAKLLPDVYWNSTSDIFRLDNTDHVITVNIRDQVNIICPLYTQQPVNFEAIEYSEIYSVSKWGYDACHLTPEAKIVGVCRTPFQQSTITVVFREFTPLPGGLEFTPGQTYYFVSTSNGSRNGLNNKRGGLCEQKNMKLKFIVHPYKTMNPATTASRTSGLGDDGSSGDERRSLDKQRTLAKNSSSFNKGSGPVLKSTYSTLSRKKFPSPGINENNLISSISASNSPPSSEGKNDNAGHVTLQRIENDRDDSSSAVDDDNWTELRRTARPAAAPVARRQPSDVAASSSPLPVIWYEIHTRSPNDEDAERKRLPLGQQATSYGDNSKRTNDARTTDNPIHRTFFLIISATLALYSIFR